MVEMLEKRVMDDPDVAQAVIQEVLGVVPEINRNWLRERTGYNPLELTNWILDNIDNIPLEPNNMNMSIESIGDDEAPGQPPRDDDWLRLIDSEKRKDAMVPVLVRAFQEENQKTGAAVPVVRRFDYHCGWWNAKDYICRRFVGVRTNRLEKIFSRRTGSYIKSMIIALLVEMRRYTQQMAQEFGLDWLWWDDMMLLKPRKRYALPAVPQQVEEADNLVADLVERTLGDPAEIAACSICFEDYSRKRMVHCGEEDDQGWPLVFFWMGTRARIVSADGGRSTDVHYMCLECFREQAKALCTDGKLAEGGQGLTCVELDCDRIYPWAKVKTHLDAATRKILGRRIDQEALVVIGHEMEHCKTCNFGMTIDAPKDEMRFFECPRCRANFCRTCKHAWWDHAGRPCDEMGAVEDEKDRARRQLEEELAAAILRRCHRCRLQFAKTDGCNKMTCRCGATQCYVCRAANIGYDHFCNHVHNPGDNRCPVQCAGCKLWEKKDDVDRAAIAAVKERAQTDRYLQELANKL